MRLAIATEGNYVSEHFGHCEGFTVFEIEEQNIKKKEFLNSPAHVKGLLPKYLKERGVDVIVSGGMGQGAIDLFKQYGIEVYTGVSGVVENIVMRYMSGVLVSSNVVCSNHEHSETCGGH